MFADIIRHIIFAGVMELADVRDSKSRGGDTVRVRPPPPAPNLKPLQTQRLQGFPFICNGFPPFLCILSVNENIIRNTRLSIVENR